MSSDPIANLRGRGRGQGLVAALLDDRRQSGSQLATLNATEAPVPDAPLPSTIARPYAGDADFWRVRALLIETYPITPTDFNWDIRLWDGRRFHRDPAGAQSEPRLPACLWETADGRLVAAVYDDGPGKVVLGLHPDYRHLEEEMVSWAEENLAPAGEDGSRRVGIYAHDYDSPRRRLLARRGYEPVDGTSVIRRLRFGERPLPKTPAVSGYVLRQTRAGDDSEHQRMADLLNAGFGRTFHTAAEYRHFVEGSPSFRHDLNLVAEAPAGSFAAHVGLTYDEANRRAIVEPVVTHPEHRRRGLARALMLEGFRRVRALGATDVYVGTGDAVAANELYEAVGFTEAYTGRTWRRVS